jgi:predicted O-linked N-acetylglucosamine transferase (SPINDLY family)
MNLQTLVADGHAALGRGDISAAERAAADAVALAASDPRACQLEALVAERTGDLPAALASLDRALAVRPGLAGLLVHRAVLLRRLGRRSDALEMLLALASRAPERFDVQFNLAVVLHDLGRHAEAMRACERATASRPGEAAAWHLRGQCEGACDRLADSERSFRRALEHDPSLAAAALDLGTVLLLTGSPEASQAFFEQAARLRPDDRNARSARLIALQHDPSATPERVFEAHVRWGTDFAAGPPRRPASPARASTAPARPRLGYVSPRPFSGPMATLFAPVLEAHDRDRFEIFLYFTGGEADTAPRGRAEALAHWRNLSALSADAAARQIEADGIDLLVDLAGHSPGNRLDVFALRPAPVQASWLDYFATTGVPGIDRIVVDPHLVLPGDERWFVERLAMLPRTRLVYRPLATAPPLAAEPPARRAGVVTFGSFGRLSKVNARVLDAWARILGSVPDSRLLLKAAAFKDPAVGEAMRARLGQRGVDGARLLVRRESAPEAMLAEYADVDVVLDTFPFTGCATTLDALAQGVPVVTMAGETMLSRQGAAILANLGCAQWIAGDADAYLRIACALAESIRDGGFDRPELRRRLLGCPMSDVAAFTSDLEAAYDGMLAAAAARSAR